MVKRAAIFIVTVRYGAMVIFCGGMWHAQLKLLDLLAASALCSFLFFKHVSSCLCPRLLVISCISLIASYDCIAYDTASPVYHINDEGLKGRGKT